MTIQTRATVTRTPEAWEAYAHAYDDTLGALDPKAMVISMRETRQSWPEAMQAAQVLLRDVDQTLLDEVYADRSTRRMVTNIDPGPSAPIITDLEATA